MSSSPNPPIPPVNRPQKSGMAGFVAIFLAIVCIVLGVVALSIHSAKKELEQKVEALQKDVAAAKDQAAKNAADVSRIAQERETQFLRVSQLPAELQATRPGEAVQKINTMYEAYKAYKLGGSPEPTPGPTPGPVGPGQVTPVAGDASSAALEAVAKLVIAKSFDTKAEIGNDAGKAQTHKNIQMVLARIGAFSKPITGNQKDTMDAVMAFQKANKLKVDGIVGKGTWGEVRKKFEALKKPAAPGGVTAPMTAPAPVPAGR